MGDLQCKHQLYDYDSSGNWRRRFCRNKAVVEGNGLRYCRVHDPDKKATGRPGMGKSDVSDKPASQTSGVIERTLCEPDRITVRMRREIYKAARLAAVEADETVGKWIAEAIRQRLNRLKNRRKGAST